jgi:hypothetical protein
VLAAFLATAGVIFLVVVCSPPEIARHDLIGSYTGYYDVFPKIMSGYRKGIYKGGTHQLQMEADGTYTYVFRPSDGNSIRVTGTWTLLRARGYPSIEFDGLMLAPSNADTRKSGTYSLPIHQSIWGRVRITIDDDLGYYWIRR